MEKQNLSKLFSGKVFRIPDYQRGYAWEEKQCNDLIEDIDALVSDSKVKSHYTGTVVTYSNKETETYNRKSVEIVDVVDGQQRLTTISLFLAAIIHTLIENDLEEYKNDIPEFLYYDTTCRLTLNNETAELFYQLIKEGIPRSSISTPHQKRLASAYTTFKNYIGKQLKSDEKGIKFIVKLFEAITGKLVFTYYTIEEECEIGMTFELMNSRGKGLSVLELLKNYLMHWVSRNGIDDERKGLTDTINNAWKDTYTNIGKSTGKEEQCLRIAWILYCHHLPQYWIGYDGFKSNQYIPLRDFSKKTREQVKDFIVNFSNGLAEISKHYSIIVSPTLENTFNSTEYEWLSNIHNSGNIANFLPLLVATRILCEKHKTDFEQYVDIIKSLERYAYRVFLFEGKRSNAGKSSFYRWGKEIFDSQKISINIIQNINALLHHYATEDSFIFELERPFDWYSYRNLLRYTLFEYEKYLLNIESKGQTPRIKWEDLSKDSTIEHILPQTIEGTTWNSFGSKEEISTYTHDIGNLVLTRDNSSYSNFKFSTKKGTVGKGRSYSNSDIRQERKIASYSDWTISTLLQRREELVSWIKSRWQVESNNVVLEVNEDADGEDQS